MENVNDKTERPLNLRELGHYYRYFYSSRSCVSDPIDKASGLVFKLNNVGLSGVSSLLVPEYISKFFREMCSNLNLWENLCQIYREYLVMGNCTIFVEDNDCLEVIEDNKINTPHDKNVLYKGWKRLLILDPNQVGIQKIPISDKVFLTYIPDSEVKRRIGDKDSKIPEYFIKNFDESSSRVSLNRDPSRGSFAEIFRRLSTNYDIIGLSVIERHRRDLSEDKDVVITIPDNSSRLFKFQLKKFVEECLFRPVAIKKGFVNMDNSAVYPEVTIS